MSIYCIGQAVYDITFPVAEKIEENRKYRVENKFECIGAPATNAASLCGIWDAKTALIARIGKDSYGKKILEQLKINNVNTDYVAIDNEFQTPLSMVVTNILNGNRTLFNFPGKLNDIKFHIPKIEPNVILVDGHELEVSKEILKKYPNALSVIDAGSYREATKILSKEIDYFVCSQDFLYQYAQVEIRLDHEGTWKFAFQKLRELTNGLIVVTLGKQGLLYEDAKGICYLPAYKSKAVDTTGAGDVFHGAFAYCLDQGYELFDTLKISSMAAALSVRKMGGQLSIPTKEEVNHEFHRLHNSIRLK